MDEAVLIGLNISQIDLSGDIDRYIYFINSQWSEEQQSAHNELKDTRMQINTQLSKSIKEAAKGDDVFKSYKDLCYLVKPNHLISKPILAALIIKQTKVGPKLFRDLIPQDINWKSHDDLFKVWAKGKKHLKTRDFLKSFATFDIRSVKQEDIALVKKMYQNDKWMTADMVTRHKGIEAESNFALQMFRWVNKIMEFVEVAAKMQKIGILEIDNKIKSATDQKALIKLVQGNDKLFQRIRKAQAAKLNQFEESKSQQNLQQDDLSVRDELLSALSPEDFDEEAYTEDYEVTDSQLESFYSAIETETERVESQVSEYSDQFEQTISSDVSRA